MSHPKFRLLALASIALLALTAAFAQTDPGVRSSTGVNAGQPLGSVSSNPNDFAFFQAGLAQFNEHQTVTGDNPGLGPRFNLDSCGGCHSQPAPGGTSPNANVFPNVGPNPQSQAIANGLVSGSTNSIPFFVAANGPVREARFPFFFNPNGTANLNAPNGGVEDLFTVSGRSDAGNCSLQQPSFNTANADNDIIFRIPTPTFGTGLMANIDDSTLLANQASSNNNNVGVSGTFNHNGNDGTISRFGWKAQNKSLLLFACEAYNVEMGITNELFTQDRPLPGEDGNGGSGLTGLPSNCLNLSGKGYPEDTSNPNSSPNAAVLDDVSAFANFMRFLAPPPPGGVVLNGQQVSSSTIQAGGQLFSSIGCASCHNPTPGSTQVSNFVPALSNAPVPAFSDIEIHHMGSGLADNVSQGGAGGDQFRTAPLWGLGQRIFLLHDGRTTDLNAAIAAHESNGSEASNVEENFDNLSKTQQQEILDFLRSL